MAEQTDVLNIEKPGTHGQQYPRIAEGFDEFDKAIAGRLALALSGTSTTLTESQGRYAVLVLSGSPGGAATLTVPAFTGKQYLVFNNSDQTVTVKMATGTGVAVAVGAQALIWNDGTNVVSLGFATTAYVDAAVVGLLDDKGNYDCSANPNYPAASKGDVYTVSVAGKIGGASGITVEVGDVFRALADNAGGTQGSVGSSWAVINANIVGALTTASIGVSVQAYSANLDTYASIAPSANTQTFLGAADYAAMRSQLGLGTGDSPQFTALNIGHATDTALARVSAGVLSVGGVNLLTTATGASLLGGTALTDTYVPFASTGGALTNNSNFFYLPDTTGLNLTKSFTDPAGTRINLRVASESHTLTADNANVIQGIYASTRINQAGFNFTSSTAGVRAMDATCYATGSSGTVTGLIGMRSVVGNTGAGTVTTAYAFYANAFQNTGGGTLTNAVGFHCPAQTAGTNIYGFRGLIAAASSRYNIYMDGTAQNWLAGQTGIGTSKSVPTAWLELAAGTMALAPFKFTSGSLKTTPVAGEEEFNVDDRYTTVTTSAARKRYVLEDSVLVFGRVPYATTNGRLTDASTFTFASGNLGVSRLTVAEQSTPSTPASGYGCFYAGTDSKPYFINDAGTATDLTSGGGGGLTQAQAIRLNWLLS